jgi:sodium-dependent dicarboxylate transporter 2/3/5
MVTKVSPPGYKLPKGCSTIVETVNKKLRPTAFTASLQGKPIKGEKTLMDENEVARNAKIMVAILFLAAFLWGTEALPLGGTDVMVGVLIYLFAILPFNEISQAYMTDAVFFIFGILAVAVGVSKTGLDKRIGLILLSRIKSAKSFAFMFFPLLAL